MVFSVLREVEANTVRLKDRGLQNREYLNPRSSVPCQLPNSCPLPVWNRFILLWHGLLWLVFMLEMEHTRNQELIKYRHGTDTESERARNWHETKILGASTLCWVLIVQVKMYWCWNAWLFQEEQQLQTTRVELFAGLFPWNYFHQFISVNNAATRFSPAPLKSWSNTHWKRE